jgi:hypothetical protein
MMGKQEEGYGIIQVLAGGVDVWKRAGHHLIGDMRN